MNAQNVKFCSALISQVASFGYAETRPQSLLLIYIREKSDCVAFAVTTALVCILYRCNKLLIGGNLSQIEYEPVMKLLACGYFTRERTAMETIADSKCTRAYVTLIL